MKHKKDNISNFEIMNPSININEYIGVEVFHPESGERVGYGHYHDEMQFNIFVESYKNSGNMYFTIALTDGNGFATQNMVAANMIVLDFDYKDEEKPEIHEFTEKLKQKLNLFFFQVVDSGHGYHIYIPIEKTHDLDYWIATTKRLQALYNADGNAVKKTQLMRVPFSYNMKYRNRKCVNPIWCKAPQYRYTLDNINKMIDMSEKHPLYFERNMPCTSKMLKGVNQGYRNFCLCRIIGDLKLRNKSEENAWKEIEKWNKKNHPPKSSSELRREFVNYWHNYEPSLTCCNLQSPTMQEKLNCFCDKACKSNQKIKTYQKQTIPKIKVPKAYTQKSVLQTLNGNELAILIYIYWNQGIAIKNLKENSFYSNSTITKYVKTLQRQGYIYRFGNQLFH